MSNDDERQARMTLIRAGHTAVGAIGEPHCGLCSSSDYPIWPCDAAVLLSELDAATARAERARVKPCALGLEYRDGVVCSEFGDADACTSHQVVRGLRKHAVDADRWELRARALANALAAAQGIIHEGLHGGSPTVTEHQAACDRPACKRIRAALAEGATMASDVMRIAECEVCGEFMNCDEIDAAYLAESDSWVCGPCVRRGHECRDDMCCYGRTGAAGAVIDVK